MIKLAFEEIIASILTELDISYNIEKHEDITYFYFPIDYRNGGRSLGIIFFSDAPILSMRAMLNLSIDGRVCENLKPFVNIMNEDISFFRVYLNSEYKLEIASDFEFVEGTKGIKDIIKFYMMVLFTLPGQVDDELKHILEYGLGLDEEYE